MKYLILIFLPASCVNYELIQVRNGINAVEAESNPVQGMQRDQNQTSQ
jgi:hypothetical protein